MVYKIMKHRYVVNTIGKDAMYHLISLANVLHAENPLDIEDDWIETYITAAPILNRPM